VGISQAQRTFPSDRPVSEAAARLAVTYIEAATLDSWLSAANTPPLAIISFGRPVPAQYPCLLVTLDLPQLDGPSMVEVWSSDQPVRMQQINDLTVAMSGDFLMGSICVDEQPGLSLEATACTAYRQLLRQLHRLGYPHLWRVWNYFPHINEDRQGLERYRQFCVGRYQALVEFLPDFPESLPAGTAVGTRSGPLQVYVLAGMHPATHLGNPRQLNAYEYPDTYGPRSPSFARATFYQSETRSQLYIAGMASVVGHTSRHVGLPAEQTREMIQNLKALLGHAEGAARMPFTGAQSAALYKVYVRDAAHLAKIREVLRSGPLSSEQVLFLQGELCRKELLVEIEGLITSD
jgi:chorismate lyase / 3-hydroxybenzoate synthase